MHPLDGIHAKIKRGVQHVDALNREIDRIFTKRKRPPGFQVRHEFHPEDETFRIVISKVDQLPLKVGTLVGDAVHNFRSALDQLVFELAFIDNGGSETGLGKTGFPASTDIDNFRGGHVQNKLLAGMTQKHRAMIKRFQPYQVRKELRPRHLLTFLDDLSNDDKHRLLQPMLIAPQGFGFVFPGDLQGHNCHFPGPLVTFGAPNFIGRPLEPDAEIFRAPIVVTGADPEMPADCISSSFVGLRDGRPIQDCLETIVPFVREIVDTFAPEFETRKALRVRDLPRYGRIRPPTLAPSIKIGVYSTNPETGETMAIPIRLAR